MQNHRFIRVKKLSPPLLMGCKSHTPQIMGVINVTPDSFYTESRVRSPEEALDKAMTMVDEGASMIDVGAEPTNPETDPHLPLDEELARLIPVVTLLAKALPIPLSVDTSKPEVMAQAVQQGAQMINDVRALREPGAMAMAATLHVPVCLMHMSYPQGVREGGRDPLAEGDAVACIKTFLQRRVEACISAGISEENLILDPGIGAKNFGKSGQQSLMLLARLDEFCDLGLPVMVGVSRKSFIGEVTNLAIEDRLASSLAASVIAVRHGASIIRTHDVRPTVEALQMTEAIMAQKYE